MIEFRNIRKVFGDKVVLDGVSHTMETGKKPTSSSAPAAVENSVAKMPGGFI